jgi:4-hydroxybenzoate polyprenyltransferase
VRLKQICLVKNVSSALGWVALAVLYPNLHAGGRASGPLGVAAMTMFIAVWCVEIVWDLRDVSGDRAAEVRSLPIVLGEASCRRLGQLLNASGAALIVLAVVGGVVPARWLLILFNSVAVAIYLRVWRAGIVADRRWSHALVVGQTMLLAGLCALSG